MAKQPHNEHELELALTRLAGSNVAAVKVAWGLSPVVCRGRAEWVVGFDGEEIWR